MLDTVTAEFDKILTDMGVNEGARAELHKRAEIALAKGLVDGRDAGAIGRWVRGHYPGDFGQKVVGQISEATNVPVRPNPRDNKKPVPPKVVTNVPVAKGDNKIETPAAPTTPTPTTPPDPAPVVTPAPAEAAAADAK